jgi:hypothetical protein
MGGCSVGFHQHTHHGTDAQKGRQDPILDPTPNRTREMDHGRIR